jgi:acetolactate synthase-1/2/3 large subunit
MAAQELATAARYRLRVITIVHNDSTYGAIKLLQRTRHDRRYAGTDLNNPDFVKLGESFGVPSCQVSNAQDFTAALQRAFLCEGPSLIEIREEWRSLRL